MMMFIGDALRDHASATATPAGSAASAPSWRSARELLRARPVGGGVRGLRPGGRHLPRRRRRGRGRHRRRRGERLRPRRRSHGRIQRIYQLKRELVEFKRAVLPLQRPLAALVDRRRSPRCRRRSAATSATCTTTSTRTVEQVIVLRRPAQLDPAGAAGAGDRRPEQRHAQDRRLGRYRRGVDGDRRHLRHELREHAGTRLAVRLPGRAGHHARRVRRCCTARSAAPAGCRRWLQLRHERGSPTGSRRASRVMSEPLRPAVVRARAGLAVQVLARPELAASTNCVAEPRASSSAARSLAESASDWTLSRPVSTVDFADSIIASVRPLVERVLPYSSHWSRLARRRAISAPAAPTAAPATSSPPSIIGQRLMRGSSLISFALPLRRGPCGLTSCDAAQRVRSRGDGRRHWRRPRLRLDRLARAASTAARRGRRRRRPRGRRPSEGARSSRRVHRASVGPASWPDAVETSGPPPIYGGLWFWTPPNAIPRQPACVPCCPLRVILPFRPVRRRPNAGSRGTGSATTGRP